MTAEPLRPRRRVLLTMLLALGFRYPPGAEPAVIAGIRQLLSDWSGLVRIYHRASVQHRASNGRRAESAGRLVAFAVFGL